MDNLSYKQMVLNKMGGHTPDTTTMTAIDVTDAFIEKARTKHPDKVEEFLISLAGHLNNCHFDADTASWVLGRMKPVVLMENGAPVHKDMASYMEDMGATPAAVMAHVKRAYETAKAKGRTMGVEAPAIPAHYNQYDAYVAAAMYFADYWMMEPDMEKAAMFTYLYLSDPDYDPKINKIWDYLMD